MMSSFGLRLVKVSKKNYYKVFLSYFGVYIDILYGAGVSFGRSANCEWKLCRVEHWKGFQSCLCSSPDDRFVHRMVSYNLGPGLCSKQKGGRSLI